MATPLKIIFAGTPEFAAMALLAILKSPHSVVAVYTQPDRPAGRGQKVTASPVKVLAEQQGIPIYQPVNLRGKEEQQTLAAIDADIMVVAAYGLLLPQAVLDIPRLGCINIHGSLLPRWRGAAPIQRAILAGDTITGITMMQMDKGLDTGPMLQVTTCPILPNDTSGSLHDRLAALGAESVVTTLNHLAEGALHAEPQPTEGVTYAHKLVKSEAQLNWQQPAAVLARSVRAYNPWPVASFEYQGEHIRVWQAEAIESQSSLPSGKMQQDKAGNLTVSTAVGSLRLDLIQFSGEKPLSSAEILRSSSKRHRAFYESIP